MTLTLAILASGSGTTMQNLLDLIAIGQLNARIAVMIASRPGIKAIDRANAAGVPAHVVDRKSYPSIEAFSTEVFRLVEAAKPDLICLAGWLSKLAIRATWNGRIMNIHPALLPSFGGQGMYGSRVHKAVLEHGCKVSGCTVHFVDDQYDAGPIIVQRTCPVLDTDTPDDLAHRVFEQEKLAYPQAIRLFQHGRLKLDGRRVTILPEPH